ncbi:ArsR family transcriptional regulator [Actinomadura sp. KC06]|uniref:ArsR/SmtB family transcription factor n=1 Tax=Actinomadura sp. KC06 TaxID=2530369 RepID=UPI00105051DA|nr:helix-turn-helix domain-containing protein [Actinomadura sp. KC06]TDD34964.1 ArsR family transcriptional regulator [Actinomadura sp. KC06]
MSISVAKLLADDTRAAICLALLDGRAWTAGELAQHVGVARSTATEHLTSLVEGGLLSQERQGRHRYVRLAGAPAAELIENLIAFSPRPEARQNSLRGHRVAKAMAFARTCYDHLAGTLGVAISDRLVALGVLSEDDLILSDKGRAWFAELLGSELVSRTRRPLARPCLDWTERRPHLAGVAGQELLCHLTDQEWLTRYGPTRALRVTVTGKRALEDLFDLKLALQPANLASQGAARPVVFGQDTDGAAGA